MVEKNYIFISHKFYVAFVPHFVVHDVFLVFNYMVNYATTKLVLYHDLIPQILF